MSIDTINPVGEITELQGSGEIVRADGTVETITRGLEVYNGDTINTDDGGSVNITFEDESSFAVSEDSSLVVDEFVYAPDTEAGVSNFSMLKGMFVYTSGMIGRDDPDDVMIETPVGSIGIRGTIIAGNVDSGEITVIEGAIVLKDFTGQEMTLASQFETATFGKGGQGIDHVGNISASEVMQKFEGVSDVSPDLFSSVEDTATETKAQDQAPEGAEHNVELIEESAEEAPLQDGVVLVDNVSFTGAEYIQHRLARAGHDGDFNFGQAAPQQNNFYEFANNYTLPFLRMAADTAPAIHNPKAPAAFFNAAEGQLWSYSFAQDFIDLNSNTPATIQLTGATVGALNSLSGSILDTMAIGTSNYTFTNAQGQLITVTSNGGWEFDPVNGNLVLAFDGGIGDQPDINIGLVANDGDGNISNAVSYNIGVFGTDQAVTSAALTSTDDAQQFVGDDNMNDLTLGSVADSADDNVVFMAGGNDSVTIVRSDIGNTVFLGDGDNEITLEQAATGNIVFGGTNNDTVNLNGYENDLYLGDGNDIVEIDSTNISGLYGPGVDGLIDAGGNQFGLGDALQFSGGGTIDFTQINNQLIKNIETLDLTGGGSGNYSDTVILSYDDIIAMTDGDNILRITSDADIAGINDTIQFDAMGHDTVSHTTGGGYDRYVIGDVTLFIDADAGNNIAMPVV